MQTFGCSARGWETTQCDFSAECNWIPTVSPRHHSSHVPFPQAASYISSSGDIKGSLFSVGISTAPVTTLSQLFTVFIVSPPTLQAGKVISEKIEVHREM